MIRLLSICLFFCAFKGEGACNAQSLKVSDTSILYIFTGSDWCANCKRLEKNVLSDSLFLATMASNKIKIERIDFPQRSKQNPETKKYNSNISEKVGFNGAFPTLVIATKDLSKFSTIYYSNEKSGLFTLTILNELKALDE
jgi:thiol-disulfide isomerase/thioredoxin